MMGLFSLFFFTPSTTTANVYYCYSQAKFLPQAKYYAIQLIIFKDKESLGLID